MVAAASPWGGAWMSSTSGQIGKEEGVVCRVGGWVGGVATGKWWG